MTGNEVQSSISRNCVKGFPIHHSSFFHMLSLRLLRVIGQPVKVFFFTSPVKQALDQVTSKIQNL